MKEKKEREKNNTAKNTLTKSSLLKRNKEFYRKAKNSAPLN